MSLIMNGQEYAPFEYQSKIGLVGGYVVTFKVGDEDYYFASCHQGDTVSAPPKPLPTFSYWKDENNNIIVFPYQPNTDTTLYAVFAQPVFLLHFNNSVQDTINNILPLETRGTVQYTDDGKFDEAIIGNGSAGLYFTTSAFNCSDLTNGKTFEFWYKPTNTNGIDTIFGWKTSGDYPSNKGGKIGATYNMVYIFEGSAKIIANNLDLELNVWHHIAFVFRSSSTQLYIDGILKTENAYVHNKNTDLGFILTNGFIENLSNGCVDEFAIFDFALYDSNFTPPSAPYGEVNN